MRRGTGRDHGAGRRLVPGAAASDNIRGVDMGKILVVDDAKINRMILRQILKEHFEIIEAGDGLEALDVLGQSVGQVEVVLLDAIMPVLSGFDFLEEAKSRGWLEHTPVIMVSTDDSEPFVRRAYEGGAVDYIKRPFDRKDVLDRIMMAIERSETKPEDRPDVL